MDLQYDIVQIQLTSSICTSVAILATVIRLFLRRLILWFDDVCAVLSMLFLTAHMGIIVATKPSNFTAHYAIFSSMFFSTVWLARLSILLTIIRINPKQQRRPLFAVVILFIVLPAVLIGQIFWVCDAQQTLCQPTQQIAIFKLVSDVIADLFLLASSLHLFLVIQDKALRFRLSCLFSTCVFTTVVSIVNSLFILKSEGTKIVIIAIVEGSVSLISANIPALSSVFISVGVHTSQQASRGVVTSIPHFVQHTDTQASEIPLTYTTDTIIKTSPSADILAQERHHNPASNPDDDV